MKPDPAKNQVWGAIGAHLGVFPKIPARDFFSGAIYFRGKCAPNAPQTPAGPGADSEKMGYSAPENRRIPGLRAPPGRAPRQEGPGATFNRWHTEPRQPAAHSPGGSCRGGASVARWRPCPFTRHPHRPGIASRAPRPCCRMDRPRLLFPGRGLPSFDPLPVNPAGPIRANGFQPMRAAPAARPIHDPKPVSGDDHRRRIPDARPDSRFLV